MSQPSPETTTPPSPATATGGGVGFPLSPQQRRAWRLHRSLSTPRGALAVVCRLPLPGGGEAGAAEAAAAAWSVLVRRYEILHSRFTRPPGMSLPVQVPEPAAVTPCGRIDLRAGGVTPDAVASGLAAALDPAAGKVARAAVLTLPRGRRELVFALSALAGDAATLEILAAELAAGLAGGDAGPEEPVQYAEVADWLNGFDQEEEAALAREHWRGRLDRPLPAGPFPWELRGVAADLYRPRRRRVDLEPALAGEVASAARSLGVEPWLLVLAGWDRVTAAMATGPASPLGLACTGRWYEELRAVPGPLTRYVPLRRLDPSPSPADAVAVLAAEAGEAEEWQEGFLWEDVTARQGDGGVPFFPYAFRRRAVSGPAAIRGGVDRAHLELVCGPAEAGVGLELRYDSARVEAAVADHLTAALGRWLEAAVARPAASPGDLGQGAARRSGGGARGDVEASGLRVDQVFARLAARDPGRPVVVEEDRTWTRGELEERASRWAGALHRRGVGPEQVVGVLMPRGAAAVAAVLAVLKAGGAYLPLDPGLPAERLRQLVADSGARWVLTGEGSGEAGDLPALPVSRLDAEAAPPPPAEITSAAGLAYVIYTSGSTGRPKGVAVEHRQLTAYVEAVGRLLESDEETSYAMVSTLAADLGHTALFGALLGGGRVYLPAEERVADGRAMARRGEDAGWDVLKITPGHLRALLDGAEEAGGGAALLPRRWLVLGGEPFTWDLVRRVHRLAPGCRVLNEYGPTETTVGVLAAEVTSPGRHHAPASPPAGRDMAHARVHLARRGAGEAGVWEVGEIQVGGPCVVRGYRGRPAATAERFVPDPWSPDPGARLYRTGDLGRRLPGGGVEFLGRMDDQVKIRGYRVEPGEVAARLEAAPTVSSAAVVVRPGPGGESRLVAYAVAATGDGPAPTEEDLRRYLADRLPDYMVPHRAVLVERLPLTANGKLDRDALPEPPPEQGAGRPPAGPVERRLADLWEELLGVEGIAAGDDFFRLGGHSLLAIQLRARLRQEFSAEIPLEAIFDHPTLESLAGEVAAAEVEDQAPLEIQPRDRPLPLSFAQERLWVLYQLDPASTAYNIYLPLALGGPLRRPALMRALQDLVARHESLRTSFREVDGRGVQVIEPAVAWRPRLVDLTALPGDRRRAERDRLGRVQSDLPFDLARAPLWRVWLLATGEARHALLLTVHHIIADGWSSGILLREALTLYEARVAGREARLPELPAGYADFAVWQRRRLGEEALERDLDYWRRRLAGAPEILDLPFDRPRPEVQSDRGGTVTRVVPDALASDLEELCDSDGTTLFIVLAAGMNLLLHWATGRTDVVLGADVANRERAETHAMVGFFVNQLVLRTDLAGEPTLAELLRRTRGTALGAYAHQDLPFERLVAAINPQRRVGVSPLFQVKLLVQHAPPVPPSKGELEVERLLADLRYSQLDLLVNVMDVEDGLWVAAEYSADLFDPETVEWLLRQLERALGLLTASPEMTLSEAMARLEEADSEWRRQREDRLAGTSRALLQGVRRRRAGAGGGAGGGGPEREETA